MIVFKMKMRIQGKYIFVGIFTGDPYQLAGELHFRVGEFQLFGAALGLGAERTNGHMVVIEEYPNGMTGEEFMREVGKAGIE